MIIWGGYRYRDCVNTGGRYCAQPGAPTPTPTPTASPSPTATFSPTPTATATFTPTVTPTATATRDSHAYCNGNTHTEADANAEISADAETSSDGCPAPVAWPLLIQEIPYDKVQRLPSRFSGTNHIHLAVGGVADARHSAREKSLRAKAGRHECGCPESARPRNCVRAHRSKLGSHQHHHRARTSHGDAAAVGQGVAAEGQRGGSTAREPCITCSSGTWTATGSMSTARYSYTATLRPSGKVPVAGGPMMAFIS